MRKILILFLGFSLSGLLHVSDACTWDDVTRANNEVENLETLFGKETEDNATACALLPEVLNRTLAVIDSVEQVPGCESLMQSAHSDALWFGQQLQATYCNQQPVEPDECEVLGHAAYGCVEGDAILFSLMPGLAESVNTVEVGFSLGVQQGLVPLFTSLESLCGLNETAVIVDLWACAYQLLTNCTDVNMEALNISLSLGNVSTEFTLVYNSTLLDPAHTSTICSQINECDRAEAEAALGEMDAYLAFCQEALYQMYLDVETLNCAVVTMVSDAFDVNPNNCSLVESVKERWFDLNFWFLSLQVTCWDQTEAGQTPPNPSSGNRLSNNSLSGFFLTVLALVSALLLQVVWRSWSAARL